MFYEYINKKELFFLSENTAPIDYPMHIHQMLEIVHVLKGTISMGIHHAQYSLYPGDMAIIFPNIIHSYFIPHPQAKITNFLVINIHPDILPLFKEPLLNESPDNPHVHHSLVHEDILFAENHLKETKYSKDSVPLISALTSLVLARIFPHLTLSRHDFGSAQGLAGKILSYIGGHFTENLTQSLIANQFGLSTSALSRVFTQTLQMNFNHYINSLRVNYAKYLLTADKTLPITDITFECGYQNQQTFNRIFKAYTGSTPREYRQLNKEKFLQEREHRNKISD